MSPHGPLQVPWASSQPGGQDLKASISIQRERARQRLHYHYDLASRAKQYHSNGTLLIRWSQKPAQVQGRVKVWKSLWDQKYHHGCFLENTTCHINFVIYQIPEWIWIYFWFCSINSSVSIHQYHNVLIYQDFIIWPNIRQNSFPLIVPLSQRSLGYFCLSNFLYD